MILVHPTYFSPIVQYVHISKCTTVLFEVHDNFQKQTYRNRCHIYAAQGKLMLNVPLIHQKGQKPKTRDVKIDYKDSWNTLHLKTLQSAYNSSPFFEFYCDDLTTILSRKYHFLLDLNLACHHFVLDALELDIPTIFTEEYLDSSTENDARFLALAKPEKQFNLARYIQVFEQEHGFLSNLSILDLLFMEGPNALNYLESQQLEFPC